MKFSTQYPDGLKLLKAHIMCHLTLVMFLHYLPLTKTEKLRCLPLNGVSGSERTAFGGSEVALKGTLRCRIAYIFFGPS